MLSSCLSSPVKWLDIETGKENFYSNVQDANFLNISEWTIPKYKKSRAVFKNRLRFLAVDKYG